MPLETIGSMSFTSQADASGLHHVFFDEEEDGDSFVYMRVRQDASSAAMNASIFAERVASVIEILACKDDAVGRRALSGAQLRLQYDPDSLVREQKVRLAQVTQEGSRDIAIEDSDERWDLLRDIVAYSSLPKGARGHFVDAPIEVSGPEDALEAFYYDHTAMGTRYGSERATMHPMVQSFIETTRGEISSLIDHLRDRGCLQQQEGGEWTRLCEDSWTIHDRMLYRQLGYLQEVLEKARNYQALDQGAMIDSNYYRDLLKVPFERLAFEEGRALLENTSKEEELKKKATKSGRFDSELYRKLFRQEAIKLGAKVLSKEQWDQIQEEAAESYIPFLTNCWRQQARASYPEGALGKEYSWMRLGAFYDSRNILFPLDELLDPVSGLEEDEGDFIARVRLVIDDLLFRKDEIERSGKPKKETTEYHSTMAAIDYALRRLAVAGSVGEDGLEFEAADDGQIQVNVEGVFTWLSERRAIAQTHFLSLLEGQVRQLAPGDTTLSWAHISLLKPDEDKIEKMGWTHVERNESRDMKWAFDHFRGAQITFSDEEGLPRVKYDEKGKPTAIVLNRKLVEDRELGEEPIALQSYCVSCSVASGRLLGIAIAREGARNAEAISLQREFNHDFFEEVVEADERAGGFGGKFQALASEDEKKRMKALKEGQSDFYAAEDLSLELLQRGWKISMSCQSGKDRTGYVCSRLAQRVVLQGLERAHEAGAVKGVGYHLHRYLLNLRPFDPGRVTQAILRANTGAQYVKVGVLNVPGSDPLGFRRLRHYIGLVREAIGGTAKAKQVAEQRFSH